MIPDAFGWDFVNNRILCDHYAKRGGFLVYLPEFMNGQRKAILVQFRQKRQLLTSICTGGAMSTSAIPLMDKIMKPASWLVTLLYKPFYILKALSMALPAMFRIRSAVCKPRVISFFQALRTSPPPFPTKNLKIGAAGFCWGGQHTVFLCQDTPSTRVQRDPSQAAASASIVEPLIDCGFTAHPSFVNVPGDIEKVEKPLSVAVGNEDMAMKGKLVAQMKEILEVKKKGDHEVVIMPGAKHGFAIRTNPDDKLQMDYAEKAEEQAVAWFGRWFT